MASTVLFTPESEAVVVHPDAAAQLSQPPVHVLRLASPAEAPPLERFTETAVNPLSHPTVETKALDSVLPVSPKSLRTVTWLVQSSVPVPSPPAGLLTT